MESPQESVVLPGPVYKTYKRRWYILGLFSVMALHQGLVWNTFGPIDKSVIYAYGWQDSTVAMMANWGGIIFLVGVFHLTWFMEVRGLRETVILITFFMAVGTILRCLSEDDWVFLAMSHICAILNGLTSVTALAAPPAISAIWFPPSERTTATCINLVFGSLGNAVAYTLGPFLVPVNPSNETKDFFGYENSNDTSQYYTKDEIKKYIGYYMMEMAVVSVLLLAAFVIYFPDKPPTPPSPTSLVQRTNFKQAVKELTKNWNVLLCAMSYGLPVGVVTSWQAVMVINFSPLGVSEKVIGLIGFVSTVAFCAVAPFVAISMDRFKKHFKSTLVVLCVLSTVCFGWLCLICVKVIPFNLVQLYISTILGTGFISIAGILFYEYTVELAYPAPEGVVGAFLAYFNNLLGSIFFAIFFIKNISFVWINYVLVAVCAVAVPATALTKASYRRLDVDEPEGSSPGPSLRVDSSAPYSILDDSDETISNFEK